MFEYLLYYPVTFILWVWHKVFGFVLGETNAISWVLGIAFLTFTVRAILFKPFVSQVRSMKKMQDFAPEIKKIQKRYANDKQRQAQAMQKLQREHGVNPLGGCLPILLQVPVFIGLNHTLRAFQFHYSETTWGNYFFDRTGVKQYIDADLFGSHLGEAIYNTGLTGGTGAGAFHATAIPVAIPLMILASVLTHLTARHSVERQNPASATQQTAMMNKLTLYVFPIGLLVFGAFLPLGLLIYFLSNNAWTLMQQRIVYTRIDREEEAKKAEQTEKRSGLAPKPGQKPTQQKKRSTTTSANGASGTADKGTPSKDAASKDSSSKGDAAKTASSKPSPKSTASSKNTGASKSTGAKKQGTNQGKAKGQGKSSNSSGDKTAQGKSSGNSSTEPSSTAPQNGSSGSDSASETAKKKADRKRR
ncbi:membrane protein insertase YidC [Haloechinothrix halophila]|uniref:membrane protein insertase YidC n=1 Tax=Haloechinothrix halophila TaxID=1069073 RepID=UPI0003FBEFEC|nr:membrane protein insertase YidC [Haloechinothrix halophila]